MSEVSEEVQDKPLLSTDKALEKYIDNALDKIDEISDLLIKAEEAYTMSKSVKPEGKDWRNRRDGFRTEGTINLNKAKVLFLCC